MLICLQPQSDDCAKEGQAASDSGFSSKKVYAEWKTFPLSAVDGRVISSHHQRLCRFADVWDTQHLEAVVCRELRASLERAEEASGMCLRPNVHHLQAELADKEEQLKSAQVLMLVLHWYSLTCCCWWSFRGFRIVNTIAILPCSHSCLLAMYMANYIELTPMCGVFCNPSCLYFEGGLLQFGG